MNFRHIIILISLVFPYVLKCNEKNEEPNIIIILADDMGYSDMGAMGGEIKTPNLDSLAQNGILYKQFYNGARCCPTRASLLTGLYPHKTGMGWMTSADLGTEGYTGELNQKCITIPELLKSRGYNTYMVGKWHLVSEGNINKNGDKSAWPLQRGFDRFFGTLTGSGSYYTPTSLTRQDKLIKVPDNFYYTDAISDTAVSMIQENSSTDTPLFMYVAYTAPHWPLHAYKKDFQSYIDMYSCGWDSIRQQRFQRQIEMGIVDAGWILSNRHTTVPAWDSLSNDKKDEMKLRMAIYAAQVEVMDQGIGRIIRALKKSGELDNTLIFFLQDNGASAEKIHRGNSDLTVLGTDESFESYHVPWANASNTPFRWFKHKTYEGGIATPLIVYWPEGVVNPRRTSNRPGMVMDIMNTIVDLTSAKYPSKYKGNKVNTLDGESLLPSINNESDKRKSTMFWEHEANRAIRYGDWKLVLLASPKYPFDGDWELYDLSVDRTEMNNLAESKPGMVDKMKRMWEKWAQKNNVYPLDNRSWGSRLKNPKLISIKQ